MRKFGTIWQTKICMQPINLDASKQKNKQYDFKTSESNDQ